MQQKVKTFAKVIVASTATLILGMGGCLAPGEEFPDEGAEEIGQVEQEVLLGNGVNSQSCELLVETAGHQTPGETYVPPTGFVPWTYGDRVEVPPDIQYFTQYYGFFQRLPISLDPDLEEFIACHNGFCEYIVLSEDYSGMMVSDAGGHFGPPERFAMLGNLAAIGAWEHPELIPRIYIWSTPDGEPPMGPPGPNAFPIQLRSPQELAAIASQMVGGGSTVKAIVISHPHTDHAGDTVLLKTMFPQAKVVNNRWLRRIIMRDNAHLALSEAENTTQCRFDYFIYDGKEYQYSVPVETAHTDADSVMISPNGTMVAVDIFHAGRVSFTEASLSKDVLGLIRIGRYAQWAAIEGLWTQASWGHFNIGYPSDVERAQQYWSDLLDRWPKAMVTHPVQTYFPPYNNPTGLGSGFDPWKHDVANEQCGLLDPEWATDPFAQAFCPEHAHEMHKQVFLRRYFTDLIPFNPFDPFAQPSEQQLEQIRDVIKVDFSPLAPGEGLERRERCEYNPFNKQTQPLKWWAFDKLSPRGKVNLDTPGADSQLPYFQEE